MICIICPQHDESLGTNGGLHRYGVAGSEEWTRIAFKVCITI